MDGQMDMPDYMCARLRWETTNRYFDNKKGLYCFNKADLFATGKDLKISNFNTSTNCPLKYMPSLK